MREDQQRIVRHPAQTKVISCGRRWGKTFMAGVYALAAADYGAAVAWVVPVYKNARAPWRFAEAAVAPITSGLRVNRTERVIEFPSGGLLSIYSADNDVALRGEAFDLVIVDEAARVREETYTDVLLPTLADRDGRMLLISTPKGRNWFWVEWMRGQGNHSDIASWTAPSAANPMPSIRKAAMFARERVSERTYRQEWLAEFIDDGAFFTNVDACATAQQIEFGNTGQQYCIGVDWARAADGDSTVFSVVDARTRAMAHMVRFSGVDYNSQRERLTALWKRFNKGYIVAESNSMGGPLVEALQAAGLPVMGFNTTAATKHELMSALDLAFDQRTISILPDQQLLAELKAYSREERTGYPSYGAPAGMHDDCVMALALAWHGVNNRTQRPRVREY